MANAMSRRGVMIDLAAGGSILLSGCRARAQEAKAPPGADSGTAQLPALAGRHQPVPLPFAPGALPGLSERLITSHHDNNYVGAVKKLNLAEQRIAQLPADTPGYVLGGLMRSMLMFQNSAALHELYFGNLGGDGKISGSVADAIARGYGSVSAWEAHFKAVAKSLGGGSGWAMLSWDTRRNAPCTSRSGDHSQLPAGTLPLLVVDMYEHSYHMDYGTAAGQYIEAVVANLNWSVIDARYAKASA